jgi:uncharacterized protein (TIGR03545 family)/uncharacterized protein (TIGR03546 family)
MNFFIKLFKALNSAQKPWQITLAVILGMLMGLTPLSGIQTFLILLIAFVVNIHLGFFFIMAAQFAAVGYLFDGIFDDFGFYLLSLESLEGLWTSMYNSGLMRLTYFNNTIVLGSTVISLILTLPMYFMIAKFLTVYRERIAIFCANNKILNKFGFFDAPTKKEKAIRIWGLGAFVGLSATFAVIIIIFLDSWLKTGLEKLISLPLDKEVHIENLDLSWSEARLQINGLSIASDKINQAAVTIKEITTDVDFNAVLLHKAHIETILVSGVEFDQETSLFKKIKQEKKQAKAQKKAASTQQADSKPKEEKDEESMLNLPSVDEVLSNSKLTSKTAYESAEKEIHSISKKWEQINKDLQHDDAIKEIERDFKSLHAKLKKITLKNLKSFQKDVKNFNKKINVQKARYKKLEKDFNKDNKHIKSLIAKVKKANASDKKRLSDHYKMNGQGGVNLLGSFFGPKVQGYLQTALDLYEKVAPYLESEEEIVVDRHKGRNIRFTEHTPQADLLISHVKLDGSFEGQDFKAHVKDVSNNQKVLNKAITFTIDSDGSSAHGVKIKGSDDRRGKEVVDTINYSVKKVPNISLDLAMVKLHKSNMAIEGQLKVINESQLSGESHIQFSKSHLTAGAIKGSLGSSLNKDLAKVKNFKAKIGLGGSLTSPNIKVSSELSKIMQNSMNSYIKNQVKAFQNKHNAEIDKIGKEQLSKLGIENKNFGSLNSGLSKHKKSINNWTKKSKSLKANPKKNVKKDLKKLLKF